MTPLECPQKLFFVLGKGGVGRTTCAVGLAQAFAARGERVLVVQWALQDSISPLFGKRPCGHTAFELSPGLSTMNFSPDDAIREYFVEHLGLKLLHQVVIENKQVQRLIHAAPGVQELFFLGRLFWLVALAKQERGLDFTRIIVDTPATGHGVSLFTLPATISSFGMTGPLATESERVARMLADPHLVGTIVVTLPEELPVEETLDFVPRIVADLARPPVCVISNRSIRSLFSQSTEEAWKSAWFVAFQSRLATAQAREVARILLADLAKRNEFEDLLKTRLQAEHGLDVFGIPDVQLLHPTFKGREVIEQVAMSFAKPVYPGVSA